MVHYNIFLCILVSVSFLGKREHHHGIRKHGLAQVVERADEVEKEQEDQGKRRAEEA